MNGLFINQEKSNCSIYESGIMIFNALKSPIYKMDYMEISRHDMNSFNYVGYDFYVFNWHHNTLPVSKETLQKIKGLKIGIVLEVGVNEIKPFMKEDLFDAYMVIDPTKEKRNKFYPFPRPLEKVNSLLPLLSDVPVFGIFGFLSPGKNFAEPIRVAASLGIDCIVRINIPEATHTGHIGLPDVIKSYGKRLMSLRNGKVDLRITHDYMDKPDLIGWCSQNSLNVFPYYRNVPGLSAVTDQAIVAGRGIAITDCNTFRHMSPYISYYPKEDYLSLTTSTIPGIKQMQLDWSNENFASKFKEILDERIRWSIGDKLGTN